VVDDKLIQWVTAGGGSQRWIVRWPYLLPHRTGGLTA
jgi:hypothetical protein